MGPLRVGAHTGTGPRADLGPVAGRAHVEQPHRRAAQAVGGTSKVGQTEVYPDRQANTVGRSGQLAPTQVTQLQCCSLL